MPRNEKEPTLTSASFLKVAAAIAELQTRVIAVTRLVADGLYDGVRRRFLHDAGRVSTGTAQL